MILLVFGFFLALLLSVISTPLIIKLARALHVVDIPTERKVHVRPTPRLGGLGMFLTFAFSLTLLVPLLPVSIMNVLVEPGKLFFIAGGLVAFGVGLYDDFKRVRARYKLCIQIVAAMLAYAGGVRIETIGLHNFFLLDLGWAAPFVSVFWIVLVINAINLIDGLDGLAAGISFLAAIFLGYICFIGGHDETALIMAILSGTILGFLCYNFHPASIFMGDGGSYFLGYMLATFSILSSIGNQSTFTILIPMLALALPIIDVTMATIRRFIHGQAIFSPDKLHFHHMLLQNGFSHRNAVLVLYGVAIFISLSAFLLMKIHNEKSLTIVAIVGMIIPYGIIKLGYFRYYDKSAFIPWLSSIGDEAGLSHQRRSFFDVQVQINKANNLPELWEAIEKALHMLKFINCAVYLTKNGAKRNSLRMTDRSANNVNRRKMPALTSSVTLRKTPPDWYWINPELELDEHNRSLFRIEMDLEDNNGNKLGTLLLVKDQRLTPVDHFTLKRIEHLRRSIIKALARMQTEPTAVPLPERFIYTTPIAHREPFLKGKLAPYSMMHHNQRLQRSESLQHHERIGMHKENIS